MLKLTINAEAVDTYELELAIVEALRLIKNEVRHGMDSNDASSFDFTITGEEEEPRPEQN